MRGAWWVGRGGGNLIKSGEGGGFNMGLEEEGVKVSEGFVFHRIGDK